MGWLHYLLETNIYLGVFYALYFLLLGKETYYKLNRAYLLCTPVLSYIIPLIQVGRLKPYEDGGQVVTTIIYNPQLHQHIATTVSYFTVQNILIYGYIAGAVVMLTVFAFKIFQLIKLTRLQKNLLNGRYKVVKVEDTNTAFSFFNYVFIGTNVSGADTMIRHELVHIDQKHSVDIVFMELIKIINWFNPFIYLLQRSLKTVHEYIADEHTAAYENDVLGYSSFLVSNAYGLSGSSISNSFFNYNLLKKRIIMLNQKRSGNLARLKYLAALPVCAGLLCASTLGFSKTYGLIDLAPQKTTDTIKKLKVVEVRPSKTATKVTGEVNVVVNNAVAEQKTLTLKEAPASGTVKEVTIDPVNDSIKAAELVKEVPDIKITGNVNVVTQGKKVTKIRITGKEVKNADVKEELVESPPVMLKLQNLPPPPPPVNPLDSFYKYVAKHIRYPKSARDGRIAGKVIIEFDIAGGKINNAKVVRGLSSDVDGEALRVLNDFSAKMNTSDGAYAVPISFVLYDKNDKLVENPKKNNNKISVKPANSSPASKSSSSTIYALNEIVVTSYVN